MSDSSFDLRVGFLDVPVVADASFSEAFSAAFYPWLDLDRPPLLGTSGVSVEILREDVQAGELRGTTVPLHADRSGVRQGKEIVAANPLARYVLSDQHVQLHYPEVGELELLDALQVARSVGLVEVSKRGAALMHCCALRSPAGLTVLLIGDKGAGKTTLALELIRRGFALLSGDKAQVLRDLVVGFPEALAVDREDAKKAGLISNNRPRFTGAGKQLFLPGYEVENIALELHPLRPGCVLFVSQTSRDFRLIEMTDRRELERLLAPAVHFSHAVHGEWLGSTRVLSVHELLSGLHGVGAFAQIALDARKPTHLDRLAEYFAFASVP